nr:unnamed protein product [Spirometra erinaceieuropaei]
MDISSISTHETSTEPSAEMGQANIGTNGGVRIHRIQYRCAEERSSTSTHVNHSTLVTVPSSPSPEQKLTSARRLSALSAGSFNSAVSEKTDALHSSASINSLSAYASAAGVEPAGSGEMRRLRHFVKASGKQQQEQRHISRKDFNISTDSETQMTNSFDSSEVSASSSLVRAGSAATISDPNLPTSVESELSRQVAILRKSQSSARAVKNMEDRFKHSTTICSENMIHSMEEQCQALEECLRLLPSARELSDHTGNAAVTSANARAEDVGMSDFLKTMDLPIISHSDLDQVIKTSLPAPENVPSPEDEPKSKPAAMAQTNCRKDLLRNLVETVVEQSRSAKKDADLNREYIAILENLSKQAEDVCQSVICSGGLDSLLYACRSEDPEILKHAVFALANLTIHGGESSQIELVKQHAVEWLFPIALHNNELLRYYAFLTLLLLLVNKDLMPTVANSELLGLFVPFVNSHNPVEFTKESQLDEIIFSREWMSRLLPALTIDRREAQALAVFHFVAAITSAGNSLEKFCPDAKKQNQLRQTLRELAETENIPTSTLASQALSLLGIPIPKCLSMQVCQWSIEDVVCWMSRIGFDNLVDRARNLNIDGDLLLTVTESELRDDLGLSSSLTRRRFMREIVRLKCKSDYSSIDRTQLADFLIAVSERLTNAGGAPSPCTSTRNPILWNVDLTQYTYNLLSAGVTRPLIAKLSDKDLLEACRIENPIHRQQILEASKNRDVLPAPTSCPMTSPEEAKNEFDEDMQALQAIVSKANKLVGRQDVSGRVVTDHAAWKYVGYPWSWQLKRQRPPHSLDLHKTPASSRQSLISPTDEGDDNLDAPTTAALAPAGLCTRPEMGRTGCVSDQGDLRRRRLSRP